MVAMPRGRKPKASPRSRQPTQPPTSEPCAPPARLGTVTLWGEILQETDRELQLAIKNHGDAGDLGLCGTHWIAKRQIFGRVGRADGFDYVRVSYAYATLLAQSAQPCE